MSSREESILLRLEAAGREAPRVRLGDPGAEDAALALPVVELRRRGRFELVGPLAEGGVGEVVKGRDIDLGRDVAIKILREGHAKNPEIVQRFVEEAQIGGQLHHPGIVPVYELGLENGRPFFAMKLVKGRTLAAALKPGAERPDERRLLAIFEQVCRTVAYAHARGVVHRDLKPSNVMIGAFGEVHVLDWGFAKVLKRGGIADERRAPSEPDVTKIATVRTAKGSASLAGSVMGTPAYMPPEQAMGRVDLLDTRSDVFSLGAILCEILTGKPPYCDGGEDLLVQAMHGRLGDAHARLDACGAAAELVALAKECLRPLRKERPHDAGALARRVQHHLASAEQRAHEAVLAATRARNTAERALAEAAQQRRARRLSVLTAAAVLLALLAGAGGTLRIRAVEREEARRLHATVATALEEAQDHRGAGRWPEARAAAARAAELSRAEGVDPATRSRSRTMLEEITADANAADAETARRERESAFVAQLEEIRLERGDRYDPRSADRRYMEAFGNLDAAKLLAAYPGVLPHVAAALDDWAWLRRASRDLEGADWRSPAAMARAIDPDDSRNRLRDAVAGKDLAALRALAAEVDGGALPAVTVDLLGVSLAEAGDVEAASRFYSRVQPAHAGDFWISYHAGHMAGLCGRFDEAARYLTAAMALRPRSSFASTAVGHALRDDGDLDGAIAMYRAAGRPHPGSAHFNVATVLYRMGDLDGAIAEYREAIRLRPDTHAHCNLGVALEQKGDVRGAIAAYREAIRLDARNAWAYSALGSALGKQGEFEKAIAAHDEAIRLQPDLATAYSDLGATLFRRQDFGGSVAAYREASRLAPDGSMFRYNLGNALRRVGDHAAAVAAYGEAIRLRHDYAEAHCNLGHALMSLGRFREALASFRTGHDLGTRQASWSYPSADWAAQAERMVELDERLPGVLSGEDKPRDGLELTAFGRLLSGRGMHAEAAALYAAAFARDPSLADDLSSWHRYNAACCAVAAGKPELRPRALEWLRADLALRAEQVRGRVFPGAMAADKALEHWLEDPDLASVRGDGALAELPGTEREKWRALWSDVAALLEGARE